jgi:biopolymer transport protein ExbB
MAASILLVLLASHSLAQEPVQDATAVSDTSAPEALKQEQSQSSLKMTGIPTDPVSIANAMGRPFSTTFVIASVIALWCFLERLVMLRKHRVIPRSFVERFFLHLRAGRMNRQEALIVCQQNESPISDVLMHGIRKWGRPSVEVEQAVLDGGERQISHLKKGLRVLNGVSTLCPLIGLLGTVVGMIRAFNDIATAGAMGQTETLANGIALALLTTAAGLFIAIPAMAGYLVMAGRVDSLVMEMDSIGQDLVHLVSSESLRDRGMSQTGVSQQTASSTQPDTSLPPDAPTPTNESS